MPQHDELDRLIQATPAAKQDDLDALISATPAVKPVDPHASRLAANRRSAYVEPGPTVAAVLPDVTEARDFAVSAVTAIPRVVDTLVNRVPAGIAARLSGYTPEQTADFVEQRSFSKYLRPPDDPDSVMSRAGGMAGLLPLGLLGKAAAGIFAAQGAGASLEQSQGLPVTDQVKFAVGQAALMALLAKGGPVGSVTRAEVTTFLREAGQSGGTMMAYSLVDHLTRKGIDPSAKLDWDSVAKDTLAAVIVGMGGKVVGKAMKPAEVSPVKAAPPVEQTAQTARVERGLEPGEIRLDQTPSATEPGKLEPTPITGEQRGMSAEPVPAEPKPAPPYPDIVPKFPEKPPETGPVKAAEPATAVEPTDSKPTGIKNRIVDAEMAAMGKQVEKSGGSTLEGLRAEAVKIISEDPTAGKRLVDSLSENMRSPEGVEDALLSVERNRLRNEIKKVAKELEGGVTEELLTKARELDAEYFKASQVSDTAGYKSSVSLGTRRLELNEDYSLANLVYEYTVRNEVHPEQVKGAMAALKKTAAEYETKRAALDAQEVALKEREAKVAVQEQIKETARQARRRPSATTQWLTLKANDARARIKARSTQASAGLDPAWIADYAIIAAEHISKGVDAGTALVKEFGDSVKPHLADILERAKSVEQERFTEAMRGKELNRLRPLIIKLQEHFYRKGVTEVDPMIDAIHGVLKEARPETTRTEAMHLLGGYGDFKPLSKDPVKVGTREQRTTAQLWSKLDALLNKNPILKSGVERPELTADQRADLKKINRLKKELGIGALDPETQLKSTLEANKTRYRNSLEDMQRQIDNLEADQVARGPGPSDAELVSLKAEHAAKKAEFEDIFGKPGATEAERLSKAIEYAEKSAADAVARVRSADIAVRKKAEAQGPPTAEVAELRQKLEAARSNRDATQAELRYLRSTNEQNVIAKLEARIAEVKAGVKKEIAKGATVDTAVVANLRSELAGLVKERDAKPHRDPYEVYKAASLARMARATARMHEKAMYKDFSPMKKKSSLPRDPEWEAAAAAFEQVKINHKKSAREDYLKNRTKAEMARDFALEGPRFLMALKTGLDQSVLMLQGGAYLAARPRLWPKVIPDTFRASFSEEKAQMIMARIKNRDVAKWDKDTGLEIMELDAKPSKREEAVWSDVASKIPGLGHIMRGSARGFTIGRNLMAAEWKNVLDQSLGSDLTVERSKANANLVNIATGRGYVGKNHTVNTIVNGLATINWAPRLMISRFELLLGQPFWKPLASKDPVMVKLIAKEYARIAIGMTTAQAILYASGDEYGGANPNPWSDSGDAINPHFMETRFGDTWIDPTFGLANSWTFLARLISGRSESAKGKKYDIRGDKTSPVTGDAGDLIWRFEQGKLGPSVGMGLDILRGHDMMGKPTFTPEWLADKTLPIGPQSVYEALRDEGLVKGTAIGIMAMLGWSTQSYEK